MPAGVARARLDDAAPLQQRHLRQRLPRLNTAGGPSGNTVRNPLSPPRECDYPARHVRARPQQCRAHPPRRPPRKVGPAPLGHLPEPSPEPPGGPPPAAVTPEVARPPDPSGGGGGAHVPGLPPETPCSLLYYSLYS
eukprot:273134-Prorocentrum_minimum.AAC.1